MDAFIFWIMRILYFLCVYTGSVWQPKDQALDARSRTTRDIRWRTYHIVPSSVALRSDDAHNVAIRRWWLSGVPFVRIALIFIFPSRILRSRIIYTGISPSRCLCDANDGSNALRRPNKWTNEQTKNGRKHEFHLRQIIWVSVNWNRKWDECVKIWGDGADFLFEIARIINYLLFFFDKYVVILESFLASL